MSTKSTTTPSTFPFTSPPQPPPIPIRILLLHGYTQNPHLFRSKTGGLKKLLSKTFPPPLYTLHLSYVHAPHKIPLADIPGSEPPGTTSTSQESSEEPPEDPEAYGWWRRKDLPSDSGGGIVYEGLEEGLAAVAKVIREEGPFSGVIGFSQGAAAAAMVASLLEGEPRKRSFEHHSNSDQTQNQNKGIPYPTTFLFTPEEQETTSAKGFIQPPLKFAVCYSGFRAPDPLYRAFYEPMIRTPILHVLGQVDGVVEEGRARALVGACEGGEGRVLVHPGGHFVPSGKVWLEGVVGFVKKCVDGEGREKVGKGKEEVRAEDMDVPF